MEGEKARRQAGFLGGHKKNDGEELEGSGDNMDER